MSDADIVTLFLCGDVMTGRGIDQILAHPGDPALHEDYVASAVEYVRLAERRSGAIPRAVAPGYVWGAAMEEWESIRPDARIVNLETALTTSQDWLAKGINYRMHPANVGVLTAARPDCCVLANNHILDWGRAGLDETLRTLHAAGLRTAGAGMHAAGAAAPAVISLDKGGRVLVFGFAASSSGVPYDWAATERRAGVNLLPVLDAAEGRRIGREIAARRRPGDIVVASVHWGANWGYGVPRAQRAFAHTLIDAGGADVVHGHSSHHVKAIEVYRGRPIFYGCGDFLNDYEGIEGTPDGYRDDLTCMYSPAILRPQGVMTACRLTPLRIRRFSLEHPPPAEAAWLRETLERECAAFGVRVLACENGRLALDWQEEAD